MSPAFWSSAGGDRIIMLDGASVDAAVLPGFLAGSGDVVAGLVTLLDRADESEIVTLDAVVHGCGLGTALLDAAARRAAGFGHVRLKVRTTNDNLDALRFYRRRGFRLHRLAVGAVDQERRAEPSIPRFGRYGIAIRDEITLIRDLVQLRRRLADPPGTARQPPPPLPATSRSPARRTTGR